MTAHAIKHAVARAGIDAAEVDDCIIGAALQQGTQSSNLGRIAAITAGLPVSVSGMTIDRQCSSGFNVNCLLRLSKLLWTDRRLVVAGGCESISLVQNEHMNITRIIDPLAIAQSPDIYMGMLDTAELVASRYNISREAQDEYAAQSQQRTAAGQAAGKFDDEIVALTATKLVADKETGAISEELVTLSKDEGNRPSTSAEGLAGLKTVRENGFITGGNASQLSDGAAAGCDDG